MLDLLTKILPNLMTNKRYVNFGLSIVQTVQMTLWSGSISFVLGLVFGIALVVTKKGAVLENRVIYHVLDKLINFFRSIPFIILLTGVMPLSRLIMGTSIDVRGAIVPLVFGTVPFFSRQIETALAEVDSGLVEAAVSMGLNPWPSLAPSVFRLWKCRKLQSSCGSGLYNRLSAVLGTPDACGRF